jgi:hypothetical protein
MKIFTKNYLVFTLAMVAMILPELAFAGNAAQGNIGQLLNNPLFKGAIDLGLLLLAGFKWFDYFAEFDPKSAFRNVIVPAVLTFLAFQWLDVLRWVQII